MVVESSNFIFSDHPIKVYPSLLLVRQIACHGQKSKSKMTNENAKRSKLTQPKNGCLFRVLSREHQFTDQRSAINDMGMTDAFVIVFAHRVAD